MLGDSGANSVQMISQLKFDKQGEILAAGYNSGNLVLFQYQPEGGEQLLEQQRDQTNDVEMADSSLRSDRNQQIKFPCLSYLTEYTGFSHEFDYVRAYEIPPNITSIEWLNRSAHSSTMSFVVANDKKIKLFRLRKEFVDEFRGRNRDNQQDYDAPVDQGSTFVERFNRSNGQLIFPKTQAHYQLLHSEQQQMQDQSPIHSINSFGTPISNTTSSAHLNTIRSIDRRNVYQNPVELIETYTDIHQFHINAISQSADGESLISSDDTSVTMWNIERSSMQNQNRDGEISDCSNVYYKLIDKAPKKVFELNEVITHC